MNFTDAELSSFWSAAWSVPFRSACRWLTSDEKTNVSPDAEPPTWLKPLCVQRWVGQAIGARLAWMRDHPEAALYRYSGAYDESDPSIPCWTEKGTVFYDWHELREFEEERILWRWNVEVERLLRTSEAPPFLLGEDAWTRAVLRVCEHLNQLYGELKRRHRAMRARAILREELRAYIHWDYRAAA